MGLFISTIGIKRIEAKITLLDLAYNMHRLESSTNAGQPQDSCA